MFGAFCLCLSSGLVLSWTTMQKPPRRFKDPLEAVYRYLLKILSHISLQKVKIMLPFYLQATENKSHFIYFIPNIWLLSSQISSWSPIPGS